MSLTGKQSMLLIAIEEGPLSTFKLFDCLWSVYEDSTVSEDYDPGYRDWTRSGIYASMRRLEDRGLVERCEPGEHRKKSSKHALASVPESALIVESRSLPASYAWKLTDAGRTAAMEAE